MIPNNQFRFGSGGVPFAYDADAQLYFDQLTGVVSDAYKMAINTLVLSLKAGGNWTELDRLWIHATENQQNARISLVNPTSTAITEVNSPTWTAGQGYTGNGTTMALNTNFTPSTSGIKYTLNSASYGVYCRTDIQETSIDMGALSGSNRAFVYLRRNVSSANLITFTVNTTSDTSFIPTTNTDSRGFYEMVRINSTQESLYKNGTLVYTPYPVASIGLPSVPFYLLALNDGVGSAHSTRQLSMSYIGSGGMSHLSFYNSIQTFANTIGFNV